MEGAFSAEGSGGQGIQRGGPERPSRDEIILQKFVIICSAIFLDSFLYPNWTFHPIF